MNYFKRIDLMHNLFSVSAGEKCKNCSHINRYRCGNRTVFKCSVYGETASTASDWRQSWDACGLWNQPTELMNCMRIKIKCDGEKVDENPQLDGQISI